MPELYEVLDQCLAAMERGQSADAVLKNYPALADQLRPMLNAAAIARRSSHIRIPDDARRRGRARVLQQAQLLAEAKALRQRRFAALFPRLALTAVLLLAMVLSSTKLVSASSGALPGQQLYPVKRTWESVRLWLAFSPVDHELLESQFEQERLDEISELLGKRLEQPIVFTGLVARQADGQWVISGIPVSVSASTRLPAGSFGDGAPVTVIGVTREGGVVEAQEIQVLQPGSSLPPFEPSEAREDQEHGLPASPMGVPSTPEPGPTRPPQTQPASTRYQFSGVVESIQGNRWQINGQPVYVEEAKIPAGVGVGTLVKFDGYYGGDGRFFVTNLEIVTGVSPHHEKHGGDSGGSGGSGGGDDGGGESP